MFQPLVQNLTHHDPFFVFADFEDYLRAQEDVSQAWLDRSRWNRMSLLNSARNGFFSWDRSVREYCEHIREARPFPVEVKCELPSTT